MPNIPAYLNIVNEYEPDEVIANLHISTGKIIACDPLVGSPTFPFSKIVPKGDFPVAVYYDDHDSHALAVLRFNDNAISGWQMATTDKQDLATLKEGHIFGYPVDTGLGCFTDEAGFSLVQQHEKELSAQLGDKFISYYDDVIDTLMVENDNFNQLNFQPYPNNPLNCVIFASGCGDGFYASYWGFDGVGEVVCLVTDFGLLKEDEA
jgi:Protein of unknown function (DUF4241)